MAIVTTDLRSEAVRRPFRFSRAEWQRLAAMYGSVLAIAAVAWTLFLHYQARFGSTYAAAGSLAFGFGVRHAFDADHISAIDDTTRYLRQQEKRRLGTGYFFALGHSTIVLGLFVALAIAAEDVQRHIPSLQSVGRTVGGLISGSFLTVIALVDLFILIGLLDVWRKARAGTYRQQELDELMMQRGFINRIMGGKWRRFISDSWQMYPVGLLFGLGFDTASQIGLLALATAASTGHLQTHTSSLPFGALIALPMLFTAGMVLMDTTDGVVMAQAYEWAFLNPVRKVYYNIATVALGVFIALGVAGVEFLQVAAVNGKWHGWFWDWVNRLDFETLGYVIVGLFVALWLASVLAYRVFRLDDRYQPQPAE